MKLALVFLSFIRCWNLSLLRSKTSVLRCQDCARRTPASIISRPDSPRRQDCYIVIAQSSAGRRRLYGGIVLPAVGSLSGVGMAT